MSYDLIYRKQFIKLDKDGQELFIPLVESGCSNLWETSRGGKERRVRNWNVMKLLTNEKLCATRQEMLEEQNKFRERLLLNSINNESLDSQYTDRDFGWFAGLSINGNSTRKTTFGMFKSIVTTGCKKALTLEQLQDYGISIKITTGTPYYQQKAFDESNLDCEVSRSPETDEEFFSMLSELEGLTSQYGIQLSIDAYVPEYSLKVIDNALKRKRENSYVVVPVKVKNWWSIKIEGVGGFIKFTRHGGFKYSPVSSGTSFYSKSKALRKLDKVKEKIDSKFVARLVEHNTEKTFYVKKKKENLVSS